MEEENENLEDEMDELEEEIEEEIERKPKKSVTTKQKSKRPVEVESKPTEKYVAAYQEARIGIVDTLTGEWIVEGLDSVPMATLEAMKLNKLDKIEIASGA